MQQERRAATTGGAGILLYGLTALSSYTGTALVLRSKKREDCAAQGKISAHKAPAAGTACGGCSFLFGARGCAHFSVAATWRSSASVGAFLSISETLTISWYRDTFSSCAT